MFALYRLAYKQQPLSDLSFLRESEYSGKKTVLQMMICPPKDHVSELRSFVTNMYTFQTKLTVLLMMLFQKFNFFFCVTDIHSL